MYLNSITYDDCQIAVVLYLALTCSEVEIQRIITD